MLMDNDGVSTALAFGNSSVSNIVLRSLWDVNATFSKNISDFARICDNSSLQL